MVNCIKNKDFKIAKSFQYYVITWELAVKTFIHTEFSWLSFDNVVKRVVDPKGELCIFILQKTTVPNVLIFFLYVKWLSGSSYLSDL